MPYITAFQRPKTHQLTLDEVLAGEVDLNSPKYRGCARIPFTVTVYTETVPPELSREVDAEFLTARLKDFTSRHSSLYEGDRHLLYRTFPIPKKSGGVRIINAPNEMLMDALRELKTLFEREFRAMYHTSAFAYVKGRCCVDAVKRHQSNGSRWFLKTDFSDFFGSTTKPFVMKQLSTIFPFSEVCRTEDGYAALDRAVELCFLDGGLPQGTPISPLLTNVMMIPVDMTLCNKLREHGFVYTRYADDIIISHRCDFAYRQTVELIDRTLHEFQAPFRIKPQKTRYGSSAGHNFNLGVMLNKDNEITVGWKNVKRFKAMVSSFILDCQNGNIWDVHEVQALTGLASYYKMVDDDMVKHVVDHMNQKFKADFYALVKAALNGKTEG